MSRRPLALRHLALVAVLATVLPTHSFGEGETPPGLRFVRSGKTRSIDRAELARLCSPTRISIDDPHYEGGRKNFLACPLLEVLRRGFDIDEDALARLDVIFRASDGYARPSPGSKLTERGGWLAFTDADRGTLDKPAWDPIDRRKVDPGPFYVVWSGPSQDDEHGYPWPYQLVEIEASSVAETFPLIVPKGAAPGSPERAGYEIFSSECIACHAINGQGGKIGPDLNVPMSIVEYRPEAQIKQYIRDPASFRYTSMPAHKQFSEAQLDGLVAYFRAMSRDKHDPGKAM